MLDGKVATIYVGLIRKPRRFVVHWKSASGREVYEVFKPPTYREIIKELLMTLNGTRPDFMARLAQLDDAQWMKSKHRTRRYVAKCRGHVYINSNHLTDRNTEQLHGYWVATNIGRKETLTLIELACEAAGVRRDSVYHLQL